MGAWGWTRALVLLSEMRVGGVGDDGACRLRANMADNDWWRGGDGRQ